MDVIPPIRLEHRHVGLITTNDDVVIEVDHLYCLDPAPCQSPDCQETHDDPGFVALRMARHESQSSEEVSTLLDPNDAIMLANRITRAANLVLEAQEGVPNAERELRRLAATPSTAS